MLNVNNLSCHPLLLICQLGTDFHLISNFRFHKYVVLHSILQR